MLSQTWSDIGNGYIYWDSVDGDYNTNTDYYGNDLGTFPAWVSVIMNGNIDQRIVCEVQIPAASESTVDPALIFNFE